MFNGIRKDFPNLTKLDCIKKTCQYTGCSVTTLKRYLTEIKRNGELSAPKPRTPRSVGIELDEQHLRMIRATVDTIFHEKKPPTLDIIHAEIKKNAQIPAMGRTKLYQVLKQLGMNNTDKKNGDKMDCSKKLSIGEMVRNHTKEFLTDLNTITIKTEF